MLKVAHWPLVSWIPEGAWIHFNCYGQIQPQTPPHKGHHLVTDGVHFFIMKCKTDQVWRDTTISMGYTYHATLQTYLEPPAGLVKEFHSSQPDANSIFEQSELSAWLTAQRWVSPNTTPTGQWQQQHKRDYHQLPLWLGRWNSILHHLYPAHTDFPFRYTHSNDYVKYCNNDTVVTIYLT